MPLSVKAYEMIQYKDETGEDIIKLTVLGTGNALVTECYNTCFLMEDEDQLFRVDGGGGNGVLRQIRYAGYGLFQGHIILLFQIVRDNVTDILKEDMIVIRRLSLILSIVTPDPRNLKG